MTLSIPPELEARLRTEAARGGEPVDALAVRLLDQHLPPPGRRAAATELLHRWATEADALTEHEADENAVVLRALDADRPADRPLFPDLAEKTA